MPVENLSPQETWNAMSSNASAQMVDVRTRAEWAFVGLPDLVKLGRQPILIEWKTFPTMDTNENFASQLLDKIEVINNDTGAAPDQIFFMCRSGVRSLAAAELMTGIFKSQNREVVCVNIAEGFEGDLNATAHRGETNGWKARGLAWRQS